MPPPSPLNLSRGWPASDLFPTQTLQNAAVAVLSNPLITEQGLGYGPDEGHFELRKNIANWLRRNYSLSRTVGAERICISGGASQNLACVLQVFTDPMHTRYVWMVEPIYHLVFGIFQDAGFYNRLRAVPEDECGIDVDFLEKALQKSATDHQHATPPERPYRKTYTHIIYCVPTFSNPSGTTMPLSRREALVRLARKYDALIVSDDVYDFLNWEPADVTGGESTPLPRIIDVDTSLDGGPLDLFGNCVSNGSFSKIVAPGCRVGWAEGTPEFIRDLSAAGSSHSGGAPSQLMSTFINDMLENGSLDRHLHDTLLPAYSRRARTLTAAIKQHLLPLGVTFISDSESYTVFGGYFIWLKLPAHLNAKEITEIALQEQNLVVAEGELFAVPGNTLPANELSHRLRLCFAWEKEEKLNEAVERLGQVIRGALSRT
ncbi:pyridoxal phosphate-dependent transferase [Aspergillus pseudonomiae]|uniref:Pyridoxal phosphate-dependent transferase n=1 Tax=Aspergillus pseudonomiae TaxID=1506151 RepID=A0A5N7CV23_9EURO|nr:pyridoxal phosphate-dependent transferase [Aspergillus pseudonomiae]KAE8398055.1 pyridoxal phosphate-dependent transferase [Aspergillus pseudonomiae]